MNSQVKSKFKTHKKKFHNTSAHIKLLIQSEAKMPSHFLSSQWELAVAEGRGSGQAEAGAEFFEKSNTECQDG